MLIEKVWIYRFKKEIPISWLFWILTRPLLANNASLFIHTNFIISRCFASFLLAVFAVWILPLALQLTPFCWLFFNLSFHFHHFCIARYVMHENWFIWITIFCKIGRGSWIRWNYFIFGDCTKGIIIRVRFILL